MRSFFQKFLPASFIKKVRPFYHYSLATLGAVLYGFPSRKIRVIGVTGTKGKTTTVELINAIFEESKFKTAVAGTLHFKIGEKDERNLYKMTMPGRFFLQKFLRDAVNAGCGVAIIEMTSEGAKQFRHKFIYLDALVFTNLSPEHIESHGSYEKYLDAKLSIARELARSPKKNKAIIANTDDPEAQKFFTAGGESVHNKISYGISDAWPYELRDGGVEITFQGTKITSALPGRFNISNILAAAKTAHYFGIGPTTIAAGIEKVKVVRGRMEKIAGGQNFDVYVDYAHTPDSLEKAYQALEGKRLVCVLGGTGGGRDVWKRPVLGGIAEKYCDEIILTNEDPYDEDPEKILRDVREGIKNKTPLLILDRREAIRDALARAQKGDAIIITGKGTDPYIMGPNGSKLPWDDASVVREELEKRVKKGII